MQYMMLIYETPAEFSASANEYDEAVWGPWCAYHKALINAGVWVGVTRFSLARLARIRTAV
jgi:hypothetical protein